ncbi:MAG: sulfite exporter TauE/SafE family protein [Micrococcus sp.]|nr:sulfite exporter TauE/SafE family protein [Micrococcus sp.]
MLESAPLLMALIALGFITLGAVLQRVSGMGVGMIAAPTLSLMLGPVAGVTLSNVAAIVSAVLLALLLRKDVDWPRFSQIIPLLLVGSVLGAWAVLALDSEWLEVLLGGTVLLAIAAALGLQRVITVRGSAAMFGSAAAAGFMNTTAGVAGPAIAAYAVASRWEQRRFAATLQPIFLMANVSAIVTKSLVGTALPANIDIPAAVWVAVIVAGPLGIALGSRIARHVNPSKARILAISIASLGGTLALIRGLTGVLTG